MSAAPESDPQYGERPPDYRLPAATRVGTVRLEISNLDRSVDYYTRVLGATVLAADQDGAALGVEGDPTPLIELHQNRDAHAVPRRGLLGLYHFAILLPSRPDLGRFVNHLAHLNVSAGMSDHEVSEAIYLQDPDNLGIEVYRDRPRSEWRRRGREINLTVDPIDYPGLIQSGGGEPWNGLPQGTTMGHVHLHVGDLERGSEFYHLGLGLDRIAWSYPGALFLSAGGYHHHLGTNTWAGTAASAGPGDARLLEWELVVPGPDDARAALGNLERRGYPVVPGPGGGAVADPWGSVVRIRGEAA